MQSIDMARIIGIIGGSISGNKGAEAMVTAVIIMLKKHLPDSKFILFTPYIKNDLPLLESYSEQVELIDASPVMLVTKFLPLTMLEFILRPLKISTASWLKETRALKNCDILIDVAGISFSDGREVYLPFNVLTIWPKILLGGNVVKISQACGPFNHWLNRTFAKWLLPKCKYLAARGRTTLENLQTINIENCSQCPDVAFLLNESEHIHVPSASVERFFRFGDEKRRIVGICPSSIVYKKCGALNTDYVNIYCQFTKYLLRKGYRVLFIPHSIRTNTKKTKNNDLPVTEKIVSLLGQNSQVNLITEEINSIELRKAIGKCDFFVGSRFHGMVSSLSMAVPTMVCGWGHKYFEILDLFCLRDYAFDYRNLSLENITALFEKMVENETSIREKIETNLPSVMIKAKVQINDICKLLNQS